MLAADRGDLQRAEVDGFIGPDPPGAIRHRNDLRHRLLHHHDGPRVRVQQLWQFGGSVR